MSNRRTHPAFQKALHGGRYISEVYTSRWAEPFVEMMVPIRLGPERVVAVLGAKVR